VTRADIWRRIEQERDRQEAKWSGRHDWGEGSCSSSGVAPIVKVAVLSEECGEVARAVLDGGDGLRAELVQVAAVAVAWLESLD
jgi:NTP pyrophosphatase (non-canonical NTP hydrolase)